jgi:hypothetical protein
MPIKEPTITRNVTYELEVNFGEETEGLLDIAADFWDYPEEVASHEDNEYSRGIIELIAAYAEGVWGYDPDRKRPPEQLDAEEARDAIYRAIVNRVSLRATRREAGLPPAGTITSTTMRGIGDPY